MSHPKRKEMKTMCYVGENYFNSYREAEIFCIMSGIHCEEIYETEEEEEDL